MPHHDQRTSQLHNVISADPCSHFPQTTYLDANVVLDWLRLELFNDVIDLLEQNDPRVPRWQIEAAVANEIRKVATHRGWFGQGQEIGRAHV